eukprot:10414676-Lingulodinium_polyedra.AAC.1
MPRARWHVASMVSRRGMSPPCNHPMVGLESLTATTWRSQWLPRASWRARSESPRLSRYAATP